MSLVIDGNPSPLAAVFEPGAKAAVTMIETRVRVDQQTNVHAVVEMADGKLFYSVAYVKAAGGCSAPAPKDEAGAARLGDMRLRALPNPQNAEATRREVLLMIRHPNNSGMQMDQITHYYIPARYVNLTKIFQGNDPVLTVTGGISLSQDPNFRFDYLSNGAGTMRVEATDPRAPNSSRNGRSATDVMRRRKPRRLHAHLRSNELPLPPARAEIGQLLPGQGGIAEQRADLTRALIHARDRLAGDIFVVRQERCDDVDRA